MTLFDAIGKTYNKTRVADDRIVSELIRLADLGPGDHIIADIGAGTGNYSIALKNAGFRIRAVEPSETMLLQLERKTNIERMVGCGENIPLKTSSVDAVFSVLALPHFSDIEQVFIEMARVLKKGPIILFAFDPRIGKRTWMYNYFPFCWDKFSSLPTAENTAKMLRYCTNLSSQIIPFKLPADLKDHFAAAAWKTPHLYLDEDYRLNISSFRLATAEAVENGVKHLAADLENGRWEKSDGEVLRTEKIDAGYYFLLAK
jgi:ubiquinone/menaquinone biosynthesis C-methylase UbiE